MVVGQSSFFIVLSIIDNYRKMAVIPIEENVMVIVCTKMLIHESKGRAKEHDCHVYTIQLGKRARLYTCTSMLPIFCIQFLWV